MIKLIAYTGRKKYILSILFIIGILFFGNKLREYNYASVPLPGESADEYSFGWLGISLIKEKYPIAWSGIDAYTNHDFQKINVDGIFDRDPNRALFSIDKPWFDHPPLFGVITGGYAYLKGVREFKDASVIILRRPMLKIALITTLLIFVLGTRLYGRFVGILAALLYTVIPTTLISSRLALVENGLIPLFLGALILADLYLEKKRITYWYFASFLAALAVLFKLSGISIFITLVFLALKYGGKLTKKLLLSLIIFVISATLIYACYGAYFGWSIFVNVLLTNSQRFYGSSAEVFFQVVAHPKITTEKFLTDGWILLGWISLFLVSFGGWVKKKPTQILTLATFSYLIVFIIFGSESYGWYRFPFYPFIIISMSFVFKKIIDFPNLFLATSFLLLPFGTTVHRLIGSQGFQTYVSSFRIFSLGVLLLFTLSLINTKKLAALQRIFIIVFFVILLWLSIKEIYFYSVDNWYFVT